ncbi:hypothetical protein XENTR_v10018863 [Xenopus tropicalis]|nr:hypothetical protein XENTR_v10018863 [Xenopus tropicalis]
MVQIILQAVWNNTFVGKWLEQAGGTNDPCCNGIFFSNISLQANQPLTATWTSPNTLNCVEIRAIINDGSATYNVSQVLNQASSTTTSSAVTKTSTSGSTRHFSSILYLVAMLVFSKKLLQQMDQ